MPELRKKLRTVSSKNKALQDILRSCGDVVDVVSVERLEGGVHNTKTTLKLADGQDRVHFYNRVPIQNTIPEGFISSGEIDLDIEILNTLYGCDFTEDDLIITCGKYSAKPDSLGYWSAAGVAGSSLPGDVVSLHLNIPIDIKEEWGENLVTPLIRLRTETTPGVFTEEIAVCNQISVPYWFDSSEWEDLIGNLYASLIDGQEQLDVPVIDVQKSYLDQAHTNMVTAEHDHIIENYSLKIKNPTDKPIEVCITLSYLQEESDSMKEYGT